MKLNSCILATLNHQCISTPTTIYSIQATLSREEVTSARPSGSPPWLLSRLSPSTPGLQGCSSSQYPAQQSSLHIHLFPPHPYSIPLSLVLLLILQYVPPFLNSTPRQHLNSFLLFTSFPPSYPIWNNNPLTWPPYMDLGLLSMFKFLNMWYMHLNPHSPLSTKS